MPEDTSPFGMSDDDREETIIDTRRDTGRVDNDENIPLIPNTKHDVRRTIHAINVIRVDGPNDGYKGQVPSHTDVPTIAKMFGNGIYDFHAVTADSKVIRRNSGVKISMVIPTAPENGHKATSAEPSMALLEWQAKQHAVESARTESFGKMAVDTTREQATHQLKSMAETQAATATRDREFFGTMMAQNQAFFATMLKSTEMQHMQSMERARQDFTQMMAFTLQSHERAAAASDPSRMLQFFTQGLNLAQQFSASDEDEDSSPWVTAIEAGASVVNNITNAVVAAKNNQPALVPKSVEAQPKQISAPKPAESALPEKPKKARSRQLPFNRDELAGLITLRQLMDQKGLDFSASLRSIMQQVAGVNADNQSQSENGPEVAETDGATSTAAGDVDG